MNNLTFLTGKVYPDKSFTIGIVPKKKIRSQDSQYERDLHTQPDTDYGALADWYEGTTNILGESCSVPKSTLDQEEVLTPREVSTHDLEILRELDKVKNSGYSDFYEAEPPSSTPLFIKGLESSREQISAYGEKGITGYGRRVVKNSCILLTQKWKKQNLGFGTCTLPDMHPDTLKCCLANWGDIVRRFFQKLSRLYKKLGRHFYYVGCTEIQPKRLDTYKMPVPHLHFVYKARRRDWEPWTLDAKLDYNLWNEAVNQVLAKHGFFPLMGEFGHVGSFKLERIRTSAAAYLGKYISKGVKEVERMQELGYTCFSKQWWFACMQTKKIFKDSIVVLKSEVAASIFYCMDALSEGGYIEYLKPIYIEVAGISRLIGCAGTMSKDFYESIVGKPRWGD